MRSHGQQFVWLSVIRKVWKGLPMVITAYFTSSGRKAEPSVAYP